MTFKLYYLVSSVNGKFVLMKHEELILYDIETKKVGILEATCWVHGAQYCVESLVSLRGFNPIHEEPRRWSEHGLNECYVPCET